MVNFYPWIKKILDVNPVNYNLNLVTTKQKKLTITERWREV